MSNYEVILSFETIYIIEGHHIFIDCPRYVRGDKSMYRFLRYTIIICLLLISTSCSSSRTNMLSPPISDSHATKSTSTKTLTSEELSFFNCSFFNQSGNEGIRNFFLCSIYNEPKQINLYNLFYNNIFHDEPSQIEMEYITAVDTATNNDAYSFFRITSQEVDALLVRYLLFSPSLFLHPLQIFLVFIPLKKAIGMGTHTMHVLF